MCLQDQTPRCFRWGFSSLLEHPFLSLIQNCASYSTSNCTYQDPQKFGHFSRLPLDGTRSDFRFLYHAQVSHSVLICHAWPPPQRNESLQVELVVKVEASRQSDTTHDAMQEPKQKSELYLNGLLVSRAGFCCARFILWQILVSSSSHWEHLVEHYSQLAPIRCSSLISVKSWSLKSNCARAKESSCAMLVGGWGERKKDEKREKSKEKRDVY